MSAVSREAACERIRFSGGRFINASADRVIELLEVARSARKASVPLESSNYRVRAHKAKRTGQRWRESSNLWCPSEGRTPSH